MVLSWETTGSRDNLSSSDSYKIALFFPAIDTFLSELSQRFDEKNMNIIHAIQACNPLGMNFLLPQELSPFAEMYGFDKEIVEIEAKLAKKMFDKKKGFARCILHPSFCDGCFSRTTQIGKNIHGNSYKYCKL